MDLTVEAMVIEDKRLHSLLKEEELEKARKQLGKYGYIPKGWPGAKPMLASERLLLSLSQSV